MKVLVWCLNQEAKNENLEKEIEVMKNESQDKPPNVEAPKVGKKCNKCDKSCKDKNDLNRHLKIVHPHKIKCEECENIFGRTIDLEEHMKVHSTIKRFKCDDCNKGFHLKWRMLKPEVENFTNLRT